MQGGATAAGKESKARQKINAMTRLLEKAFERSRELPADRQDEAARLILEKIEPEDVEIIEPESAEPYRPIEWMKGWEIPDSFFEPLDDELLDLFEGKSLGIQLGLDEDDAARKGHS